MKYHFGFKPDNLDAGVRQKYVSLPVVFCGLRVVVNFAIKFDCQFFGRAVKIEDVVGDTVLPPEFSTVELFAFEHCPKFGFGGGKIVS